MSRLLRDRNFKWRPHGDVQTTWRAHGWKPTTEAEREARQRWKKPQQKEQS